MPDPSPGLDDEEKVVTPPDDQKTADPSAADAQGEKTTAEVLEAVLATSAEGEEAPPDSEASGQETEKEGEPKPAGGGKPKEGEDDLTDEVTDEELNSYKPKTQRRMRQLLDQRDEARQAIETLKPAAERMQQITEYVEKAGLDSQEVNSGFEIMRLMKQDPVKALEALTPYWQALNQAVGNVLPDELQNEVQEGRISEERARELSQTRSREALARKASEEAAQRAAEIQTRQTVEATAHAAQSAVSEWERKWSSNDPDYQAKQARVMEKIELTLARRTREGKAMPTAQEAVQLSQAALDAVNAELKPFLGKRQAIDPPVSAGGAATDAHPVPQNTMDAIDMALRKTG